MLFRKDYFFNISERLNTEQLAKVTEILGTEGLMDFMRKYNYSLSEEMTQVLE